MWKGRNALVRRRRAWFCVAVLIALTLMSAGVNDVFCASRQIQYLKQKTSGTCTLTAAVMLLKETERLSKGRSCAVTEASVREAAWCEEGLYWSFTYGDHTVNRYSLPREGRAELLQVILKKYPQGIIAYHPTQPHAVWLIAYEEESGTFYAADPSPAAKEGKLALGETVLKGQTQAEKIEGIEAYWCVE